ncbi:uncharacterized protein ACNS7B_021262 [Menidia menidia]
MGPTTRNFSYLSCCCFVRSSLFPGFPLIHGWKQPWQRACARCTFQLVGDKSRQAAGNSNTPYKDLQSPQKRLEALPGPRCSLSTPRFQRGSRALQQQAAHTARTCKDQEPGENNLLHINTDLPVSHLSHCFCFLPSARRKRAPMRSGESGMSLGVPPAWLGPLSACHHQEDRGLERPHISSCCQARVRGRDIEGQLFSMRKPGSFTHGL